MTSRTDLLERADALEQLREALRRATTGAGGLVFVTGEAGIGKTSLLTCACDTAKSLGFRVLKARCSQLEEFYPHGAARQLFETMLRREPNASRWLEGAAGRAAEALGLTTPYASGPDTTAALNHSLYWLVANVSDETPLALVIDDAHWVDASSLSLLQYLLPRLDELPVLCLLAARPGEGSAQAPLAELGNSPGVLRIEPEPLSPAATATLLHRRLSREPGDEVTAAYHDATGGNPFLLSELAGLLGSDDGPAVGASAPAAVTRSVQSRLAALGEPEEALATAVAVLDTDAEVRHAARLAELDLDKALHAADRLAGARLLADERPLRFVHPLVRQAVYDAVPTGLKSSLHAEAARILDEEGDPDRAVVHLLAAEPAADPGVVDQLRAGADRAMRRGAPADASRLLARALQEPPRPEDRVAVLAAQGLAGTAAGDPAGLGVLAEAISATSDPAGRARLCHALGGAHAWLGDALTAIDVLSRGADDIRASDPDQALLLEAAMVSLGSFTLFADQCTSRVDPLLDSITGRTPNERSLLWAVAAQRAGCAQTPATTVLDLLERGTPSDGDGADEAVENFDKVLPAGTYLTYDRIDRAQEIGQRAARTARETGSRTAYFAAGHIEALEHFFRGDVLLAIESMSIALNEVRGLGVLPGYGLVPTIAALYLERGDAGSALDAFAAIGLAEGDPLPLMQRRPLLALRSRVNAASGRPADALHDARQAAAQRVLCAGLAFGTPFSATLALRAAGAPLDEIAASATREVTSAETIGTDSALGAAAIVRGLTGPPGEAVDRFAEATHLFARTPRRLEHAHALVEYGGALRRANRRAESREPLTVGMDLAHRCGATALVDRAHEELLAAGFRPRRPAVSGVDALTPMERRVCRLAAAGQSNVEIAQGLFVTRKTVETHLFRAYRKLAVSSRDELAPLFAKSQ